MKKWQEIGQRSMRIDQICDVTMFGCKQMNFHISCSSLITYQNIIILCTNISRGKTWLSLSKILFLWQHCRFQALLQDFKECSVITFWHKISKNYIISLFWTRTQMARTMSIFACDKRTIGALLF